MIPAVMMAPDVMMSLPRCSGLAHSDCHVGIAAKVSKLLRCWNDAQLTRCDHAIANATNNSAYDQDRVGTNISAASTACSNLEDSANDHDETTPEGGAFATPDLSVEENKNCAEEATDLVQRNGSGLCVRIASTHLFVSDSIVW